MSESPLLSDAQRQRLRHRFETLRAQLGELDWLCQGSLIHAPPGAWRWTRKREGKTVTLAVSLAQTQLLRRAIAQQRQAEGLLAQMRALSEEYVLRSVPDVRRRRKRK